MEKELPIFTAALDLSPPWFIREVSFTNEGKDKVLHIFVDHEPGKKFEYDGDHYSVYDHHQRTWQHLNFFQHRCHLHARVPRVRLDDGKVKLVPIPWAQPGSSFTLLFEDEAVRLLQGGMSASAAGNHLGISDKRVFAIAQRRVSHALTEQPLQGVEDMSIDETSSRKGHNYLTVIGDRQAKKVVGLSIGNDADALALALIDLEVRGAYREKVKTVTMDMSTAYISGVTISMPKAKIVFDRFHLVKKLNEGIDKIRRREQKSYSALKKSRYLWLKNHDDLSKEKQLRVHELARAYPTIGEAYRLKELFREVFNEAASKQAIGRLNAWMDHDWKTKIKELHDFVAMLCRHWYGIKTYFKSRASNALAERFNLKIQEIKRTAKGYRNMMNFMTMIYFHLGGLKLITH